MSDVEEIEVYDCNEAQAEDNPTNNAVLVTVNPVENVSTVLTTRASMYFALDMLVAQLADMESMLNNKFE